MEFKFKDKNGNLQNIGFNPTPGQMSAIDSGISASKVQQIEQNQSDILTKQDILISGQNIKTINNVSILGEGNIDIQGGSNLKYHKASESSVYENITPIGDITSERETRKFSIFINNRCDIIILSPITVMLHTQNANYNLVKNLTAIIPITDENYYIDITENLDIYSDYPKNNQYHTYNIQAGSNNTTEHLLQGLGFKISAQYNALQQAIIISLSWFVDDALEQQLRPNLTNPQTLVMNNNTFLTFSCYASQFAKLPQ